MIVMSDLKQIRSSKYVSHDLLEDWLLDLANKNCKRIASASFIDFLWSEDVVEFIFNVCRTLQLEDEIKYLATEIFEKFLGHHVLELRRYVKNNRKMSDTLSWSSVEDRVEQQMTLRILTSIQIASKLQSHYEHLSPQQVTNFLKKSGKYFSINGLLNSELRVMRTLGYKFHLPHPALYVNLLLGILFANDPRIDEALFYAVSKVLDMVYINRIKVYSRLYESITGAHFTSHADMDNEFTKIKADYMLLATCIIAAATYIVMKEYWHNIMEQLHQVTRLPRKDINIFCFVIIDVICNICNFEI
ncbi:cyclin N-terminal domain-containing protein 1-like [Stegodyphus dumicola]|uniref:cyclin N-terminal domain-containing protein 1-like n=1 Tax=Stegodyphus dumicola TaxID=202533 RepID=UPI0015AE1BB1|nr:cyclin N-terminal domain-containing protein 1-like [Stegodyphus dumicola]